MNNRAQVLANYDIQYKNVRVVSDDNSAIVPTNVAIQKAQDLGLDLVLINENAEPPICKVVELNKYKYDLQRKEKETAKAQRESRITVKEVQFKPNIDQHDFETKCGKITKFLSKGNKVKVLVQFRGRERQHTALGYDILDRILVTIEGVEFDGPPSFAGNRITAILKGNKNGT